MLTVSARWRRRFALVGVLAVAATTVAVPAGPANAAAFANLFGEGSSFAAPAIDQWSGDVARQGIRINYSPSGSAAGRSNFAQNQDDFAGTDIQYLAKGDPFAGGSEATAVAYSFVPIVAGGTSFPYNLKVGNRQITDLRLSGLTIAKIFTGQISNWADPAITKDYGAQLPAQQITVVTRSDGSGATYQFTRYLSKQYPSVWDAFCRARNGPSSNCGPTQFFPGYPRSQQRNGSDQVANYISSSYGEGSIAYNEYAYAIQRRQPVVKVLNAAGYYSLPTPSNVAIALQQAVINTDERSVEFLIQNLDAVYGYTDPRTYPISSYSYLIVPRDKRANTNGPPPRFSTDKGFTLSTWLNYVLCGAQRSSGQLGYSPLPKNLVQGGFKQVLHIPGHGGIPDLQRLPNCNNPTYSDGVNHLIVDAPRPSPCDRVGSPLNCVVRNGRASSAGQQVAGAGTTVLNRDRNGNIVSNQPVATAPTATAGPAGARTVAPGGATNAALPGGLLGATNPQQGTGQQVLAQPVSLTDRSGGTALFSIVTALEILAALLVPALFGTWLQRRRRT